jgi:DNA-binding CsgD family transcriptional regulator
MSRPAHRRGRESEAVPLIEATFAAATAGGQGVVVTWTRCATAVLCNVLGRYADATAAARQASQDMPEITVSSWALPELVEAAARTGNTRLAVGALDELAETTQPGGTDWGLGIEARCRAPGADPQESQVGRLARDGLSNPEIGARLFISSHTVQYHPSKVFAKLGIASRRELHTALATLIEADPSP